MKVIRVALAFVAISSSQLRAQGLDSLRNASPALAKIVPASPVPNGFVADAARVLSPAALDTINASIRASQQERLGDVAIAILPDIGNFTPVEVGLAAYRVWRVGRIAAVGDAQRNIGALILMVPKELTHNNKGYCWITTGSGSEGMLTDATVGAICREKIQPFMKARNYSAAALAGVDAIMTRMRLDPALGGVHTALPATVEGGDSMMQALVVNSVPRPKGTSPWIIIASMFGAIGLAGAGVVGGLQWRRNHKRTCPKCGKKMQRLSETEDDAALNPEQQVEERIASVDYDVWQCVCGEHTIIGYVNRASSYSECPMCHARAQQMTYRQIHAPTYTSSGARENIYKCEACQATRNELVTLPMLVQASVSSSSSSGSSYDGGGGGGGGGGDSSFGGSGSSDGGGGGSSY